MARCRRGAIRRALLCDVQPPTQEMSVKLAFQIDSNLRQSLFTPVESSWGATRLHFSLS